MDLLCEAIMERIVYVVYRQVIYLCRVGHEQEAMNIGILAMAELF
jgi:hypothetical protein